VGEKIKYQIFAAGLFMGDQVVELRSAEQFEGREVYRLWGRTEASRFMKMFYTVDDKWIVFIDRHELVPIRVEKDMWEGKKKAYLVYHIDQEGYRVVFENRTSGESQEKESKNLVFDIFSLAYYYRQHPNKFDTVFTFDFLEEGGLQTVQFMNEGKTQIKVRTMRKTRTFDALKMKQVGGVGIEIYVSDDEMRLPLKIVTPAKLKKGRKLNVEMNIDRYDPGERDGEIPSIYRGLAF
jgi:hypothetical protein